ETIGDSYKDSGFKSALTPMIHNIKDRNILHGVNKDNNSSSSFFSPEEYVEFYESFISKFHNNINEVTKVILGINSPQRIDDELLESVSALAKKYNLNIHSHFYETKWQKLSADDGLISPLQRLKNYDLLNEHTSLAHSIWVDDNDLDSIADHQASVISNPSSNLFLGSGVFPLKKYLKRKINIALGSDGLNCGTNHNMLEILRLFLLVHRINDTNYKNWPNQKQAYDFITKNTDKILNFSTSIGCLKENNSADIVIVDKNNFLNILDESLANQLILNTSTLQTKHVLINGKFVMKNRELTTIDEKLIRKEIEKIIPYLRDSMKHELKKSTVQKKEFENVFNNIFNI
ncbi:MAG: amidohydrolase family protein, partial [Bacillota bacterium]|nr:amidohydrolase family protein [Bacillota bacterium]